MNSGAKVSMLAVMHTEPEVIFGSGVMLVTSNPNRMSSGFSVGAPDGVPALHTSMTLTRRSLAPPNDKMSASIIEQQALVCVLRDGGECEGERERRRCVYLAESDSPIRHHLNDNGDALL